MMGGAMPMAMMGAPPPRTALAAQAAQAAAAQQAAVIAQQAAAAQQAIMGGLSTGDWSAATAEWGAQDYSSYGMDGSGFQPNMQDMVEMERQRGLAEIEGHWQEFIKEKEAFQRKVMQHGAKSKQDGVLGVTSRMNNVAVQEQDCIGTVKTYNAAKKFGFIICEACPKDVFVYERHLVGRDALVAGEAVAFDLVEDDGRP